MKTLVSTALLLACGAFASSARVVDEHSHIIPGAYMDFLRAHHAELQETFPLPLWNVDITTPDHILYGSDYPYQPPQVLKRNLEHLRQELESDAELAPYAELILYRNAQQLFERNNKQ